ncbi:unnamed protein product [Vitrella brassicaformis CCMP3155]|uniref:Uncharacterized protein n=1 Tax=Vitrella brassicaformis (strain CCMP3155) TaxID=1169540 RepID=A0A0G4EHQ8_VITBC|nr:unnamed protein product [Vitrella brassicaformis CCMP3155]|eukprot:CEL95725.1 unnamed protein product [Vitrella brassicaformis CCMP3155]
MDASAYSPCLSMQAALLSLRGGPRSQRPAADGLTSPHKRSVTSSQDLRIMSASSSAGQQPQPQPLQQEMKIEKVEARFPPNTSNATKRLVQGILRRAITPDGIRRLVRKGADRRIRIDLITTITLSGGSRIQIELYVCLLSLAIDDWSAPTALERGLCFGRDGRDGRWLVLPLWPSREAQAAILSALIQEGASVDGPSFVAGTWLGRPGLSIEGHSKCPIQTAVRAGNLTAVKTLVAHGAVLRGHPSGQARLGLYLLSLPRRVHSSEHYEAALMDIFNYLVKLDPSLVTEAIVGSNVIGYAATIGPIYSEGFIHGYLQLMMDNGASIVESALPEAAHNSSYHMIEWLCQHLSPAQINTAPARGEFGAHQTPLGRAAMRVAQLRSQGDAGEEEYPLVPRDEIPLQRAIRTLLASGAAIDMVRTPQQLPPNATQSDREAHGVVLAEYLTVLNDELPQAVMDGVNGALCPQRDAASVLTPLLPQVAWKIGAFLHKPEAVDTVTLGQAEVANRIKRAMQHFVKCAATKTAGNQEVIGGMASVGGRVVRVPLQCFAVIQGTSVRRVGLREVVHRARLDEAARYGLTGVIKGFNSHLGNDDCQFGWGQLGWVNEIGLFQPLGIN